MESVADVVEGGVRGERASVDVVALVEELVAEQVEVLGVAGEGNGVGVGREEAGRG